MNGKEIMSLDMNIPYNRQLTTARLLASSDIVPKHFQNKDGNCFIALEIAERNNMPALLVMQNLYIINGTPAWSSKYIIAMINSCGKFTQLQFKIEKLETIKNIEYTVYEWDENQRRNVPIKKKYPEIENKSCYAYAKIKETGEEVKGAIVTVEMAVKEGWYTKNGSKWPNMTELMLQYRAAAFFGNQYAPDKTMGIMTVEEAIDIKEERNITPNKPKEKKQEPVKKILDNTDMVSDLIKAIKDEKRIIEFRDKAKEIIEAKNIPGNNVTDDIIEEQIDALKQEIIEEIKNQDGAGSIGPTPEQKDEHESVPENDLDACAEAGYNSAVETNYIKLLQSAKDFPDIKNAKTSKYLYKIIDMAIEKKDEVSVKLIFNLLSEFTTTGNLIERRKIFLKLCVYYPQINKDKSLLEHIEKKVLDEHATKEELNKIVDVCKGIMDKIEG